MDVIVAKDAVCAELRCTALLRAALLCSALRCAALVSNEGVWRDRVCRRSLEAAAASVAGGTREV